MDLAIAGKTWHLLPEGFRDRESARAYPLPSGRQELTRIATITPPPGQNDNGCVYIRRCRKKLKEVDLRRISAVHDIEFREHKIAKGEKAFTKKMEILEEEAKRAVEAVKEEAEKATASLADLFALGRKGLKGQMEAHLNATEWQGEKINAKAFRDCYSMVSGTVKALGLPTDQKKSAQEVVIAEAAASLRATQDALSLAPGSEDETEQ
ncbi:MAG: hypothetical protein ACYSW3_22705 [Planctomycetota bacterium]